MKIENKCNHMNQIGLKFSLIVAASSLLFSIQSFGMRGSVAVVKLNQKAAKGDCLPKAIGDPSSRLDKNGIKAFSGSTAKGRSFSRTNPSVLSSADTRKKALARVLQTINSIGKKDFKLHQGAKFVFGNTAQASRQTADHIQINPGGQNVRGLGGGHEGHNHGGTTNAALIAHELGHYIGNKGLYAKYNSAVSGSNCNVSGYAGNSARGRNEEFAEVFAAYITNPEMLATKNESCRKALEFFKKVFGESGNPTCQSRQNGTAGGTALASSGGGPNLGDFLKGLFSGNKSSDEKKRDCASITGDKSIGGTTNCNAKFEGAKGRAESRRNRSRNAYGEAVN